MIGQLPGIRPEIAQQAIPDDERVWVPQAPGVWFRPLLLNTVTGSWCNLLRVRKAGVLSRHIHPSWVTGLVLKVGGGLLTGRVSVNQLGGPIAIASSSVEAARGGFEVLFRLIAFISVNLAVLNLLPIPILDGGQMLIVIAESLKGRPFSARARERIARAGVLAIGLLFVLVMFNDLKRLLGFGP